MGQVLFDFWFCPADTFRTLSHDIGNLGLLRVKNTLPADQAGIDELKLARRQMQIQQVNKGNG